MRKLSDFFNEHKVFTVFTVAMFTAVGGTFMKFAASFTHPLQATFLVYFIDLILTLFIFAPLLGTYKNTAGNGKTVYREIYDVWKQLSLQHKLYILFFIVVAVFGSCAMYLALPHITPAMLFILMQVSLFPSLILSYFYLAEKQGWPRKWLGLSILVGSVAFMTVTESWVNPQFFRNLSWIGVGALAGFLFGLPGIFLRKIFKDAPKEYGPSLEKVISFLPMVIVASSYIVGTGSLGIFNRIMGVPYFSFNGSNAIYPLVLITIAACFFVFSWFLSWKLSRMVTYDLSKISPGVSSSSMIAALIGLGLFGLFGIGSLPFNSGLSWIAPAGVILGSYIAASGKTRGMVASPVDTGKGY